MFLSLRCRGDSRIVPKRSPRTIPAATDVPHQSRGGVPPPANYRLRTIPTATTSVRTHLSKYRPNAAFFLKKDGTKKDIRASYAGPEAYPANDVHPSARQSATFCRFAYVTKCGYAAVIRMPPASTRSDIGICNPTFIYSWLRINLNLYP